MHREPWSMSTAREIIVQLRGRVRRHRDVYVLSCVVCKEREIEYHLITLNLLDKRVEYSYNVAVNTGRTRRRIMQNCGWYV